MNKNLLVPGLVLLAVFFILPVQAQIETEITEAAKAYFDAKMCDDYETLLGFTYPDIIEKAGGDERMRKTLMMIQENQKKKGFALQQFKINGFIEHTKAGNEVHALVPVTTISAVPGGKVTQESHLIAVGTEGRSKWYLIETTSLDGGNISKVLSNWDNTLILPFKKAPVFKEDN